MGKKTTDDKNSKLVELVAQLRDHIDLHRIIGLNRTLLEKTHLGGALLGHLQKSAHESLAIYICKIFESSKHNELNSIPGIIGSLPLTHLSEHQKQEFSVFGKTYGNYSDPTEATSHLNETFKLFCETHSDSLARLRAFRNKIGAHSDSNANITSLPSHSEFEALYGFAYAFYALISLSIYDVGPASVPRAVGPGFIKLMKSLGIHTARLDFDETM